MDLMVFVLRMAQVKAQGHNVALTVFFMPNLLDHVKRFRAGLVFKAHRLFNHSTLVSRVIKKKTRRRGRLPNNHTIPKVYAPLGGHWWLRETVDLNDPGKNLNHC